MNNFELRLAVELFILTDSEDEDDTPVKTVKIKNYAECVVWEYFDKQFQEHFRISTTTFEMLLQKLHLFISEERENNNVTDIRLSGNPELTLEKQLLISLWYLANIESFRGVADRFGVSKSTAWTCLNKICKDLLFLNERQKIICLELENLQNTANFFRNKIGFPGIVGIIDGSHIPLKAPKRYPAAYINRKGYHSVVLQGVCDHKKKFISCFTGEVGPMHDARVLRRSCFGNMLNTLNIPGINFIGDSAYPLRNNLLVPFKDNGHLTNIQMNYNGTFSKARITIEHTFALLKGRFRRLKLLEAQRIEIIPQIIMSACVLHNICVDGADIAEINLREIIQEEMLLRPGNLLIERNRIEGIEKGNNIANYLYAQNLL